MGYQPIENHGITGNMHSASLVGLDGSVDWLCLPRFDSPSMFGAILDADKGGRFRIAPAAAGPLRQKQVAPARQLAPQGDGRQPLPLVVGQGGAPGAHPLVRRRDPGPGCFPPPAALYLLGRLSASLSPSGRPSDVLASLPRP
jgi:hypothetical protein